jgi:hypothetical protein
MDLKTVKDFNRIVDSNPNGKIHRPEHGRAYYRSADFDKFSISELVINRLIFDGRIVLEKDDVRKKIKIYKLVNGK